MLAIMKRECRNYLKNPLLWIGLLVILYGIYQQLAPFLTLHYFPSDAKIEVLDQEFQADADIMEGYIPTTHSEQYALGYEKIKRLLTESYDHSPAEAEAIVRGVQKKDLSIIGLDQYFAEHYNLYNAKWYFLECETRPGTPAEANAYIRDKLAEHPYSYYFGRKFADFGGLFMGFYSAVLLAFLFFRDTRKDTYELMHTKPVAPGAYIWGKILGGFCSMLGVLAVLILFFNILCMTAAHNNGFPFRWQDLPLAALMYIVPNLLMITCVYTCIAMLFKNPLPAVPLLFVHMIYSNMGSRDADGIFGYYGRLFAIMVRFPGRFLDTTVPPLAAVNQPLLLFASLLLAGTASYIWKRRRAY